jgi:hypothetical protein
MLKMMMLRYVVLLSVCSVVHLFLNVDGSLKTMIEASVVAFSVPYVNISDRTHFYMMGFLID